MNDKDGFTLGEVLIAVGIIALLMGIVVYLLNPGQLLLQGQDGNRVAGLGTLDKAISLYYSNAIDSPTTFFMGTSSVVYVSIPDPAATTTAGTNCAGLGLPSIGKTYHCDASSTYLKTDGTGWIPINFNSYPGGSTMSKLPTDPVNTASSNEYYIYITDGIGGYELMANPAAIKNVGNTADFIKGTGLSLLTTFPSGGGGSGGSGNLWIVDDENGRIEEFSQSGAYIASFGSTGETYNQMQEPSDLAIDSSGNVWVADADNNRLVEWSATGTPLQQLPCSAAPCAASSSPGYYSSPGELVINGSGNILLLDEGNERVVKLSSTGTYISQFPCASGACPASSTPGYFNGPNDLALDASGNIWVSDGGNNRVEEFTSAGTYVASSAFGSYGTNAGQFNGPNKLAVDGSGNLLVIDFGGNRVEKFSPAGSFISQFPSCGTGSQACAWGATSSGMLADPTDVTVDGSGNIWVVDNNNQRIDKFSSSYTFISQFPCASGRCGISSTPGYFDYPQAMQIY
jgi:prepilin-type N-terminal cleavage/methylation domain-containing protein